MEKTSRRTLLRSLSSLPATLALGQMGCKRPIRNDTIIPYLNLYLKGPFSLVYYQGQTYIDILSPAPKNHHEPSMTSTTNETLFYPLCDYQLLGLASAGKTTWPSNQRLIVPGSCLKLDQGGVIDRGKQRYFSLRVPYPETILPWHVAEMTVTGKNCSFSASPKIPTGYVFIYQRDTLNLSKVTISCTVDGTPRLWDPHLAPLPGEVGADLTLEMSSILDSDPCHCAAKDGFKAQRDLFQNLDGSMKENLDLDVSYKDPSCCLTGSKPCPPAEPIGERRGPFTKAEDRSHTGADCKSGVIEIDGVSNSVTIGN